MKKFSFILISLLFIVNGHSQQLKKVSDFGSWVGVGVNYKLNKSYAISYLFQVRHFDEISELEKSISELGATYKINKKFKLEVNARYSFSRNKDYRFTQDLKYGASLRFKHKINSHFDFSYRLRGQTKYKNFFVKVKNDVDWYLRNKISLDYNYNKHKFYLGAEIFKEFELYRLPYYNKYRISLGDEIQNKLGEFNFSVLYEKELNRKYPLQIIYLRIGYTFKFKRNG